MFAPGIGVPEDPATGSACVALGGYLAARDPRFDGTLRWVVEQGFEMGRPSILEVEADKKAGRITAARVGGQTVLVCEGDDDAVTIDSKCDLAGMRAVGRLVGRALREMKTRVRPGMTTEQLDDVGAKFLRKHGARSAPQLTYDFPGFNCISVNDEIVHGVPGPRVLAAGDVVKIDVTAELDGYIADSAITRARAAGLDARGQRSCSARAPRSSARCRVAAARRARSPSWDATVEDEVNRWGHSVVRDMCGHGVGRALHEEPSVPNFYSPFTPGRLEEGMVIALEPIISESADRARRRTTTAGRFAPPTAASPRTTSTRS